MANKPKDQMNLTSEYPNTDLKQDFVDDLEYGGFVISSSIRGSGKTTFALGVIMELLKRNVIKNYIFILPSNKIERSGKYQFLNEWILKQRKKGVIDKDVTITTMTMLSPLLLCALAEKQFAKPEELRQVLVFSDDATQFVKILHSRENVELLTVVSLARHLRVSWWMLVHDLLPIVSSTIRANVNYFIFYDIASGKVLDDVFDLYFRVKMQNLAEQNGDPNDKTLKLVQAKRNFYRMFNKHMERDYAGLLLGTVKGRPLDYFPNDWDFVKKNVDEMLKWVEKKGFDQ